ncbi:MULTISPECIES: hypothetical protein [unclassified Fusibacter]|uniref:hypothetical protein n=1 Tax=unclassified Fusibacter TaxID=2624464 RepID=UPI001011CFEA|nr:MULTISPECIES: hypothetical protein [unclassified Fusibacter]MCK8060044.1 hypothetical protein [Fusibacter sp. A2]NPE22186.1 hypothetical protein [Fusibacter sp. A1]RXV60962.1 hypothetical protein DWB64_10095 [Fusibacter sp. A1]
MDQTSKDTLAFCIEFSKNNMNAASQVTMCRVWLKTAIEILEKNIDLGSAAYIKSEIESVDKWLAGGDSRSTSNDIYTKLQTIESLMASL